VGILIPIQIWLQKKTMLFLWGTFRTLIMTWLPFDRHLETQVFLRAQTPRGYHHPSFRKLKRGQSIDQCDAEPKCWTPRNWISHPHNMGSNATCLKWHPTNECSVKHSKPAPQHWVVRDVNETEWDVHIRTPKSWMAQDAFEGLMIHWALQFARVIAVCCVRHRCGNQDIRC
jgi:hypothetical protein